MVPISKLHSFFTIIIDFLIDITPQICKLAVLKIKKVILNIFEVVQSCSLLYMNWSCVVVTLIQIWNQPSGCSSIYTHICEH